MDSSLYKDVKTTRGINYHYAFSAASEGKPTLVFCHGFPSTSYDWHYQFEFFKNEGYGLVVPDMLGFGGTDKPRDPDMYIWRLLAQDIIDILDSEKIEKCIAIGHDWGSAPVSRLANYHEDRFIAFAFFNVAYIPPRASFDYEQMLEFNKKTFGTECYGYWAFFARDDAAGIIETHIDSFLSLVYPHKLEMFRDIFAPTGEAEKWITADNITPPPDFLSEAEIAKRKALLMKGGFAGALCYYKTIMLGHVSRDDAELHDEGRVNKPVFMGVGLQDYNSLAAVQKFTINAFCPNATFAEFDTGHWPQLALPDQLNAELLKWIKSVTKA